MRDEKFWILSYKFWDVIVLRVKEGFYRLDHWIVNVQWMILGGAIVIQKIRLTPFSAYFGQKTNNFAKMTMTGWSKSFDIEVKKCFWESFLGFCKVLGYITEKQKSCAWFFTARRQFFWPFFTKIYNALFYGCFRLQMIFLWLCT